MRAEKAYRRLIEAASPSSYDEFDVHVIAAILSLGIAEASAVNRTISDGVGLERSALIDLISGMFPGALAGFDGAVGGEALAIDDEEQSLRDILAMYRAGASRLEAPLIAMVARRCKSPHHLWQDLGLRNRGELSALMSRYFPRLAEKNRQDMKWKKFLYRMVCGSEGFLLCTAPVCSECDDFKGCFGAEDGESRLAWARNAPNIAA